MTDMRITAEEELEAARERELQHIDAKCRRTIDASMLGIFLVDWVYSAMRVEKNVCLVLLTVHIQASTFYINYSLLVFFFFLERRSANAEFSL